MMEKMNITEEFRNALNMGCTIVRTSCSCGGNWAWMTPTLRGSMRIYGCICHNEPPMPSDII